MPSSSCGPAQHLGIPVVGAERPAVMEDDGLTIAQVFIEDLSAILGGDRAHSLGSFAPDRRRGLCAGQRTGKRSRLLAQPIDDLVGRPESIRHLSKVDECREVSVPLEIFGAATASRTTATSKPSLTPSLVPDGPYASSGCRHAPNFGLSPPASAPLPARGRRGNGCGVPFRDALAVLALRYNFWRFS
jgi:hypothetical protein